MRVIIPEELFENLNAQEIHTTAERLTYNSADLMKLFRHLEVQRRSRPLPNDVASLAKVGYRAEIKNSLVHVFISWLVMTAQTGLSIQELVDYANVVVHDHKGEW